MSGTVPVAVLSIAIAPKPNKTGKPVSRAECGSWPRTLLSASARMSRPGRWSSLIESHKDRGDTQVVRARVPMSELFAYGIDLRERTHGRAMHSI